MDAIYNQGPYVSPKTPVKPVSDGGGRYIVHRIYEFLVVHIRFDDGIVLLHFCLEFSWLAEPALDCPGENLQENHGLYAAGIDQAAAADMT